MGPGVYRAEVRLTAHHLQPWLGELAGQYLDERLWVYSNAIHVEP